MSRTMPRKESPAQSVRDKTYAHQSSQAQTPALPQSRGVYAAGAGVVRVHRALWADMKARVDTKLPQVDMRAAQADIKAAPKVLCRSACNKRFGWLPQFDSAGNAS